VRFVRCRRSGYVFKKVANYNGAFDAKGHAKFRVKRPRKATPGYYAATISFRGTHFVRAGTDPSLILLAATKRAIKFVKPRDYPRC
jgi:hypothetical protein